ncbi:MAG: hypothetical protein JRH15_17545, partial [Deltaproteobacteria bacterium]|nr:hypothetical protein [Deltaproteobacteria bacterium]
MPEKHPQFTDEQYEFLALLLACGEPVSINFAGLLLPLSPGPLVDLLNRTMELGWVTQSNEDYFATTAKIPKSIQVKLDRINTPAHIAGLMEKTEKSVLDQETTPQVMNRLLVQAKKHKAAGEGLIAMAHGALKEKNKEAAWSFFKQTADCVSKNLDNNNCRRIYTDAVLNLSGLSFTLGKGLSALSQYLVRAQETSKKSGDSRSHAMLK